MSGARGKLSPWSQAIVCGLHMASKKLDLDLSHNEIAEHVWVNGSTAQNPKHPAHTAISSLRSKFEADTHWYPGKKKPDAKKPGPKPQFTESKKRRVAQAAMNLKRSRVEPTALGVIARCPAAALNPTTGNPFGIKAILQVFRTLCYDNDPSKPWGHRTPVNKTALPQEMVDFRYSWGCAMAPLYPHGGWFHRNVVATLVAASFSQTCWGGVQGA